MSIYIKKVLIFFITMLLSVGWSTTQSANPGVIPDCPGPGCPTVIPDCPGPGCPSIGFSYPDYQMELNDIEEELKKIEKEIKILEERRKELKIRREYIITLPVEG